MEEGERFAAKFGRVGFRRNFAFNGTWRGRPYVSKQVEVYAVEESGERLVMNEADAFHAYLIDVHWKTYKEGPRAYKNEK